MSHGRPVDALIAALAALEFGPMADRVAARALSSLSAPQAASLLEEIAVLASHSPRADRALAAMARALQLAGDDDLPRARRDELRAAAFELELHLASALLGDAPQGLPTRTDFEPPQDPEIRQMSLGHQKALARRANPDCMARLAAQGDVRVIRELMLNPRLTEALVVRIAAQRPVRPEVLVEIFGAPRWGVRAAVRRAIALNPCAPPELAMRLLPHLTSADLRALAKDGQVQASVCSAARRLAERRARPFPRTADEQLDNSPSAPAPGPAGTRPTPDGEVGVPSGPRSCERAAL